MGVTSCQCDCADEGNHALCVSFSSLSGLCLVTVPFAGSGHKPTLCVSSWNALDVAEVCCHQATEMDCANIFFKKDLEQMIISGVI